MKVNAKLSNQNGFLMLFKITGFFVSQKINNINGNDNNDNNDDDDNAFHVYLMLVYLIHDYKMKT